MKETIKIKECALCQGFTYPVYDKRVYGNRPFNYKVYTLYFTDKSQTEVGVCDKCLPKMKDKENRELVLKRLCNTEPNTWKDKEVK